MFQEYLLSDLQQEECSRICGTPGKKKKKVKNEELAEFRRRNIGYIYQDYSLFPEFTAYENVVMPILIDGKKPDENEVDDLLEELGISHCKNKFPSQMSGGEQQRVAIARALAKNPKMLLCDEPTGALDINTGKTILKLLSDMCKKNGITVVVITHNQAISAMGDKVIKIKNGIVDSVVINDNPVSVDEIDW